MAGGGKARTQTKRRARYPDQIEQGGEHGGVRRGWRGNGAGCTGPRILFMCFCSKSNGKPLKGFSKGMWYSCFFFF